MADCDMPMGLGSMISASAEVGTGITFEFLEESDRQDSLGRWVTMT